MLAAVGWKVRGVVVANVMSYVHLWPGTAILTTASGQHLTEKNPYEEKKRDIGYYSGKIYKKTKCSDIFWELLKKKQCTRERERDSSLTDLAP